MNYYHRHLGDYAKDTGHLTMMEHGAYTLLLDRYYSTEEGVSQDQAHRICRARTLPEKQAVDAVLDEFFTLEGGRWINRRADEEIAKMRSQAKKARVNGRSGGRPKQKPEPNPEETQRVISGIPRANPEVTQNEPNPNPEETLANSHKPYTKNQEPKSKALADPAAAAAIPSRETAAAFSPDSPAEEPTAVAESPPLDAVTGRAIELTAMLRKRGASLQASDPRVRAWAASGVSDAAALTALETAQQRRADRGTVQPINAGLIDAILADGNPARAGPRPKAADRKAASAKPEWLAGAI